MASSKPLRQSISARASKLVLLLPLLAAGQDAPTTIRTETRAVQIDVAVRDPHGAPVHGLTNDDFTLLDDRKPRAIAFFSAEAGEPAPGEAPPVPSTPSASSAAETPRAFSNTAPSNVPHGALTVILLDASSPALDLTTDFIGVGLLAQVRQNAIDVMAKLPEKERIAIYHISPGGLKVVQDFTTDRDLLRKSLKAWSVPIDWKPPCDPKIPTCCPPWDPTCAVINQPLMRMGAISVLDSMRIIGEKLARLPGRKNMIWLTPGFPMRWLRGMDDKSQKTLAQLNDANVALNAIDVRGVGPGLRDPEVNVMKLLTEATGGKTYSQNDIGRAILEADEAYRTNYSLGFYLADNERDGNFHKLEVRVARAGLSLSYREGYVAEKVSGSAPRKESPETELLNPVEATDIGITGAVEVTPGMPNPTLHMKLSLDPRGLTLRPQDNGPAFKVTRMFAEMDARGAILVEGQDSKEFVVPTQSIETIYIEGIHWEQTLPLVPGGVKVRVIVRDEASGKAGTITLPVGDPR
jgi:VWFA-related protein